MSKHEDNHQWTMHAIDDASFEKLTGQEITDYKDDPLPGNDLPAVVNALPFWWWLNPWKTVEQLFELARNHAETANQWRDVAHEAAREAADQDDRIYALSTELDLTKAEAEAAHEAVRSLRKKGKRRG